MNYILHSRSHKQFKVNSLPTRGILNKNALLFEIQDKFSTDTSFLKLKKKVLFTDSVALIQDRVEAAVDCFH